MRWAVVLSGLVILFTITMMLAAQQPPATAPPATHPRTPPPQAVPPASPQGLPPSSPAPLPAALAGGQAPVPPAHTPDTPLSRFEPLAAYPATTQFSVRGVLLGSAWMGKMHQPHGRFLAGYNPALRQPLAGEHDLKQARCALAMAQAAQFTGKSEYKAIASQTILTLLAATKPDPADPNCRVPVHSSLVCNRVGFAALVALAIYELPNPNEKELEAAEQLCQFLRSRLKTDGSVHYTDGPQDIPTQIDPAGVHEYPGYALRALAISQRLRPAPWKKEAVCRGLAYYHKLFQSQPQPRLAANLVPAATELHRQTPAAELAVMVQEWVDWLCELQIGLTDSRTPQWAGGFRWTGAGAPSTEVLETATNAMIVEAIAGGFQLTQTTGDLSRGRKYQAAAAAGAEFLCRQEFLEANTRHFEDTFRANYVIGAFYRTPWDGNLETDVTAACVTALVRFLLSGAGS
ncbi:MAG: hypothetical protein RMJ56_02295 [Gemmataceae bacterium]|nr:hypothetical protein [Gemmata sp.]MDW8196416.1 hypothetical protein [Gemmataceae bacterium]